MLPPLITVVVISMFKDGYEDYIRHCEDDKENNSETIKIEDGQQVTTRWGDVLVGDILLVRQNNAFPADMVLISCSEEDGVCYVETKNLDGETNLKNKNVPKDLALEVTNGN